MCAPPRAMLVIKNTEKTPINKVTQRDSLKARSGLWDIFSADRRTPMILGILDMRAPG